MWSDALIGAVCAVAAAMIVVVPTGTTGPAVWLRERIRGKVTPTPAPPRCESGKCVTPAPAAPAPPTWRFVLAHCPKCLSVWTGALVGVPVALAPEWAQACAGAVLMPYVLLWAAERVRLGSGGGCGAPPVAPKGPIAAPTAAPAPALSRP